MHFNSHTRLFVYMFVHMFVYVFVYVGGSFFRSKKRICL